MTHFLQSNAWAEFQRALGRSVFTDSGVDWSYLAILETGTGNKRLYCPYGPQLASPKALDAALESLRVYADNVNATFIRIEPMGMVSVDQLRARGMKKMTYNTLQPNHTQLIDLTRDRDTIISGMKSNNRNLYRTYQNKGISIRASSHPADIEIFLTFIHSVAHRNHITPHSDAYFRTQAQTLLPLGAGKLFIAEYEDKPIASALVFDDATTRYYAHAAADDTYRKLSAGTALLAYMIMDAKDEGKKSFDLYGIAPPDQPNHPWAGFTRFKQGFGGSPVEYVGAWDLPVRPLPYYAYKTYQTIRRRLK